MSKSKSLQERTHVAVRGPHVVAVPTPLATSIPKTGFVHCFPDVLAEIDRDLVGEERLDHHPRHGEEETGVQPRGYISRLTHCWDLVIGRLSPAAIAIVHSPYES